MADSISVAKSNVVPAVAVQPSRFGQDVTFRLPNPKVRMLVIGLLILALGLGCALFIPVDDRRGALPKILGFVLAPIGAWITWMGIKLFGVKDGEAVVGWKEVHITRPGAAAQTIELETIERVMQTTNRGQRQLLTFETTGGGKVVLPAINLTVEDEPMLVQLVLRRAELRRAGVKSRAELAAAETFLVESQTARPFAVEVVSEGKKVVDVRVIGTRDDLKPEDQESILEKTDAGATRQLYVPASVLAVLKKDDARLGSAKPLRGVA